MVKNLVQWLIGERVSSLFLHRYLEVFPDKPLIIKKMRVLIVMMSSLMLLFLPACGAQEEVGYYPSGEVEYRAPLDKQGVFNGEVKNFYKDGKVKSVLPFHAHRINGLVKRFYPNGILQFTEMYVDGSQLGPEVKYYPNGGLQYKIMLHRSIHVDTARYYYPDGDLKEMAIYDSKGRKVDFAVLRHNGEIDPSYTKPLFLSDDDRIRKGQDYAFEIVLGNRHLSNIITRIIAPAGTVDSMPGKYARTKYILRRPPLGQHVIKADLIEQWSRPGSDTIWISTFRAAHSFNVTE